MTRWAARRCRECSDAFMPTGARQASCERCIRRRLGNAWEAREARRRARAERAELERQRREALARCSRCGLEWGRPRGSRRTRCPDCTNQLAAELEARKARRRAYDEARNQAVRQGGAECTLCGRNHAHELAELERQPARGPSLEQARHLAQLLRAGLEPDEAALPQVITPQRLG